VVENATVVLRVGYRFPYWDATQVVRIISRGGPRDGFVP
jgi:hypothetical protein